MGGEGAPDIEIGASARAKRVRFDSVPETDVSFDGEGNSETERDNLPDEVEPGVEYRNVQVRWRAYARLEETWRRRPSGSD
jgi:hypothetical protein